MHHFFFSNKKPFGSILCITAHFPSFSFTLWQLVIYWSSHFTDIDLTDPEVQAAAVKIQGAFKGFKSRNNQNQPWACLVFILVREKTALPWNNLGQSSQQGPNTPKKNLQIVPLCRWLYCDQFYITLPCSFKYILPLFDHFIKGIIVASSIRVTLI